jgi:uncharacterized protein (DUF2147 family)
MIAIIKRSVGPLVIALAATLSAASANASPLGVWLDHTGRGAVEISDCNGKLCGRLVWLKEANHKEGCGLQIFGDVKPVGTNRWDNGWIIDPEKDLNTRYDVEITLQGDKLKVMGYAGMKFLSQTMIWKRAPDSLQKCNATQARAPEPAPAPTPAPAPAPKRDDGEPPTVYPPPPAATPLPPQPPAPAPAPQASPEPPRSTPPPAPKSAAKSSKDCKLEFGGISVTFPCPE